MRVRFLSLAQREVDDVVAWYEAQSENLGREFLDEMDRAVRLVKRYSQMSPEIEPDLRRILFTRFPYSLIYGIDEDVIVILAVAHQHREPRYWADRLDWESES